MKPKQFLRFLDRDNGCIHCGETEAVAPHHRKNRGMGGSKVLDTPENIIVLCSLINGLLESDAGIARRARDVGWKLVAGDDPAEVAVWYPREQAWYKLDKDYRRVLVSTSPVTPVDQLGF